MNSQKTSFSDATLVISIAVQQVGGRGCPVLIGAAPCLGCYKPSILLRLESVHIEINFYMAHICNYLASLASRASHDTLTICEGRPRSTAEVLDRVNRLSLALHSCYGVAAGDRLAIVARNTDFFFEVMLSQVPAYETIQVMSCILY